MRKLLALDLATNTGWAVAQPGIMDRSELRFGTKKLPSTGDDVGAFLDAFETWLSDMITLEDPSIVVYEAPILAAGKTAVITARKLMCLAGMTEFICRRREVMVREANILTIKKHFSGSGKAPKELMIGTASGLGFAVKDDNQADAIGLWSYALSIYSRENYQRLFPAGPLLLRAGGQR